MTRAPKITNEHVQSVIAQTEYFASGVLTICILTLENGFQVTGQSACASPENYREVLGRQYALEDAKNKVWELEGYLLKQRLHEREKQEPDAEDDSFNIYEWFSFQEGGETTVIGLNGEGGMIRTGRVCPDLAEGSLVTDEHGDTWLLDGPSSPVHMSEFMRRQQSRYTS